MQALAAGATVVGRGEPVCDVHVRQILCRGCSFSCLSTLPFAESRRDASDSSEEGSEIFEVSLVTIY